MLPLEKLRSALEQKHRPRETHLTRVVLIQRARERVICGSRFCPNANHAIFLAGDRSSMRLLPSIFTVEGDLAK